jgi:hypothetical protein
MFFDVRCLSGRRWLILVLLGAAPAIESDYIWDIEVFGYKGFDIAQIRRAMPVHEVDEYSGRTKNEVRRSHALSL